MGLCPTILQQQRHFCRQKLLQGFSQGIEYCVLCILILRKNDCIFKNQYPNILIIVTN